MHGADADELDRLAGEFDRAADRLDRESGALSGILNSISWLGDAAGRYLSDWTGFQMPKVGLSILFLRDEASILRAQANEQRSASAGAGGAAISRPGRPAETVMPRERLEERYADNRRQMEDYLDAHPELGELREAVESALARGYDIYDFDPDRGYLTWASGNLATAVNVVVTVPGTGTTMQLLTDVMGRTNGHHMNTYGDTATLTTLAWMPPPKLRDNFRLDVYERTLVSGPLGDYLTHLDGLSKNIVVTGHSAGGAAVQTLFAERPDLIRHVDGVALLAPAEIHDGFANLMGDKPVLYAIHIDDPISLAHGDPSDLVGNIGNRIADNGRIVYRDSRNGLLENPLSAHDEWRYADNYHDEIAGMFPGSQALGNGWHRQQYVDEDGTVRYVDVPEF